MLPFLYLHVFGNITETFYRYSSEIELANSEHVKPPIFKSWLKSIISVTEWEGSKRFELMNLESSNCNNGACPAGVENNTSGESPLANLFEPFVLMTGEKKHLMFSENETLWSRNMKRGIARRLFDFQLGMLPSKPPPPPPLELRDSFQTEYSYKLSKSDDAGYDTIIPAAESRGKYLVFENRKNDLRTRQTFELISTKTLESVKKRNVTQKMVEHAMEFEIPKYVSRIADFARFDHNLTHAIYLVQKKIDEVIGYLKNENFHSNTSSLYRSRSLRQLLTLMKQIDLNGFRQLYSKLDTKEKRLMFLSLLSYIGTDASVLFMCQLYHNGMLESQLYNKYLMEIPFNFKNSTENSLKAWLICHQSAAVASEKNINNTDHRPTETDKAFYLAFSVVFNKVYKYQLENLSAIPEYTTTHNRKSFFFKFIRSLYAKLENSETIEQQLNTLDVLKNALAGSVMLLNYLNETVVHKKSLPTEVRLSAFRITSGKIDLKYDEKLFMVYSAVLMDESEPLILRAAALDVILQHLNGTFHLLQPCIKHFKSSSYLYNYIYSYIEQLSRSNNPQYDSLKKSIADFKLLKDAPIKRFSTSFVRIYSSPRNDYFPKSNFSHKATLYRGQELLIKHIAEPVTSFPHLLHFQLNSIDAEDVRNDFSIYIELNGVNKYFLANILRKLNGTIPRLEVIPEMLKKYDESKMEGNVEIVVEKYGYVINRVSHRLTNSVVNGSSQKSNLVEKVWELLGVGNREYEELFCRSESVLRGTSKLHECERNSVHKSIGLSHNEENVFITDNGFTVMQSYFTPYYYHFIRNESVMETGLNFSFFTRLWHAKESEITMYNPFLRSWTGVTKLQTIQVQIPLNVEGFKMSNEKIRGIFLNKNDSLSHFLFEMKTDVYNCTENHGSQNSDSKYESDNEDVLQKYSLEKLESVTSTVKHELKKIGLEIFVPKNGQDCAPLPYALFEFIDAYYSGHFLPGICNFKLMSTPSEGSTKISVDLKVNGRYTDQHPLSGKHLSIEGNVSLIGDDTLKSPMRSYTFHTNFTSSSNDVSTEINTKLSYYTGGQPDGEDYLVTFSKQFPPLGSDVFAYGWGDESVHTKLQIGCASASVGQLQCMQIRFHIVGEISDEQKALAHGNTYPYSRCRLEQKQAVWKGPLLPRTWACYEAAVRLFYTRKVTLNAQYTNVAKNVEDFAVNALNSLNSYLSSYSSNNAEKSQNSSDGRIIQLSIIHNATAPKFDLNFSSPIGSFHYKDVPGIDKDIYNIQLDSTHFSKAIQLFESTALVRSCIANAESVLTPDNSTVPHTFNSSYDLLTSTFDRKFAVLAKKSPDGMAVKVLIGNQSLEVTPTDTQLNGNIIQHLENGFEFPKGEPYFMFR